MESFIRFVQTYRFLRYSIVGGLVALVYFGAILAFTEISVLPLPISIAGAYLLAAAMRFVLHRVWVFDALSGKMHQQAWKYLATLVWVYVFNVAISEGLIRVWAFPARYAALVAVIVVTVMAYFASTKWVFKL